MLDISQSILYRGRRYWQNGRWCIWYEPCPIVRHTPKQIRVVSQSFPESPLYPGGNFAIDRQSLLMQGKAYHSRHGEWFYLDKPDQGDLFPSKDVITTRSALELEAEALNWDLKNLNDLQLRAYVFALEHNISLSQAYR